MLRAVAAVGQSDPAILATPLDTRPVGVELFRASHPVPNAASVAAGERALAAAAASASAGGMLVLLSGGASSMMAAPVPGVRLEDKIEISRRLMEAGANIQELNCVRKHLSRVKGGRLAVRARRTMTLALSDVHGPIPDDPTVIGSGPTVADPTTFGDALDVLRRYQVDAPPSVADYLKRGARGELQETVKPGDWRLNDSVYSVIGNRQTAVAGAQKVAEAAGFQVITIEPATTGEARDAGRAFVEMAHRHATTSRQPVCIIGSGETTVTVRGAGKGGRNQEFALGAAPLLATLDFPLVLGSAGTDGIDGPTDVAGAIVDAGTLTRAQVMGLDPAAALRDNDTYPFFARLGDHLRWGPTGTNVGDLHVMLIGRE